MIFALYITPLYPFSKSVAILSSNARIKFFRIFINFILAKPELKIESNKLENGTTQIKWIVTSKGSESISKVVINFGKVFSAVKSYIRAELY